MKKREREKERRRKSEIMNERVSLGEITESQKTNLVLVHGGSGEDERGIGGRILGLELGNRLKIMAIRRECVFFAIE